MKRMVVLGLALLLAGCAGQGAPQVSGGVELGLRTVEDGPGPRRYAMSCDADKLSNCERRAAQVCPGGTRVMDTRVRMGRIGGKQRPVRDMVFICR